VDRGINEIFSEEDLAYYSGVLLQKKDDIIDKARQIREDIVLDTNDRSDDIDLASAVAEQNLTLRFLDRDRKLLKQIEAALVRINDGSYGYCDGTGEPIPKKRLEARPWCRYSVQYKEQLERNEKRMQSNGINSELDD
jgi:DnaK suppressor protein